MCENEKCPMCETEMTFCIDDGIYSEEIAMLKRYCYTCWDCGLSVDGDTEEELTSNLAKAREAIDL